MTAQALTMRLAKHLLHQSKWKDWVPVRPLSCIEIEEKACGATGRHGPRTHDPPPCTPPLPRSRVQKWWSISCLYLGSDCVSGYSRSAGCGSFGCLKYAQYYMLFNQPAGVKLWWYK